MTISYVGSKDVCRIKFKLDWHTLVNVFLLLSGAHASVLSGMAGWTLAVFKLIIPRVCSVLPSTAQIRYVIFRTAPLSGISFVAALNALFLHTAQNGF